jgi:hypothetical protein
MTCGMAYQRAVVLVSAPLERELDTGEASMRKVSTGHLDGGRKRSEGESSEKAVSGNLNRPPKDERTANYHSSNFPSMPKEL